MRLIDTSFDEYDGRQRVVEERLLDEPEGDPTSDEQRMGHTRCTPGQVGEIYRSLRKSREDGADAPGGNDLYVGEQLMLRRDLRERDPQTPGTRARRALLAAYGWCGGYGVRPARPAFVLLVVLVAACALAATGGLVTGSTNDALILVMRSVLLLPSRDIVTTTPLGDWLQVALRILGAPRVFGGDWPSEFPLNAAVLGALDGL